VSQPATLHEVLTLEEAADYLQLSPETVARRAALGEIPGRKIEGSWRFLLSALDDWLSTSDQRLVLLRQAGALADDDSVQELLTNIYAARIEEGAI
jgi:excisionase family DNA binding protein